MNGPVRQRTEVLELTLISHLHAPFKQKGSIHFPFITLCICIER